MARSVSPAPARSSSSSARPTSRPPSTAPDPTARPRSGSSFTLELPRSGSASGSRASSVSDARGTRKAGSTADEGMSTDGHKAEEGREEGAKRLDGGIKEILRVQNAAGVGKTYLCVLEGNGKQVQRSRSDLLKSASSLLSAFEAAHPSSDSSAPGSASSAASASDDAEVVVVRSLRGSKQKKEKESPRKAKGKARASRSDDDDEDMEDESSDEPDDENDKDVEEPSSASGSSEQDDDGGSDDSGKESSDEDFSFGRRSRRAAAKSKAVRKSKPEATRRSSRGTTKQGKHYDFGEGKHNSADDSAGNSSEDTSVASSVRRSARAAPANKGGRSTRAQSSAILSGESSDELGIMSKPKQSSKEGREDPPKRQKKAIVEDSDEDDQDSASEVFEISSVASEGEDDEEAASRPQDVHRDTCAKCTQSPAAALLNDIEARRKRKKPGRKRQRDVLEEDTDAEQERVERMGAWVECGICCQSYHFGCLPLPQKREITDKLKADHLAVHMPAAPTPPNGVTAMGIEGTPAAVSTTVAALAASSSASSSKANTPQPKNVPPRPKHELDPERTFLLPKCPMCKKQGGRKCFVCGVSGKRVTEREQAELGARVVADKAEQDAKDGDKDEVDRPAANQAILPGLMFRCSRCKRVAHYGCLENDDPGLTFEQHAQSYADWAICHDCYNYNVPLDAILAWAEADPLPGDDKDDIEADDEVVEQVVGERKIDQKTKKVVLIPSAKDLRANAKYLVKWKDMSYRHLDWVPHAFLAAAYPAKLSNFLQRGSTVSFEPAKDDDPEDADPTDEGDKDDESPLPDPNALERIPKTWRTVDRVLNVWYKNKRGDKEIEYLHYRKRLPENVEDGLSLVAQCHIKWGDLAYAAGTTEAPPGPEDEGYDAYVAAYKAFIASCQPSMRVPSLSEKQMNELDKPRDAKRFKPIKEQPEYITGGKLMDFQIAGVNFLRFKWWERKGCILADEMGLGKTCQIISFLSYLNQNEGARPFLVIVPNSLIGNWMREFAKWAPSMRVVPYNGDADSRKIVEDHELFDATGALKTHVVLATYEAVAGNGRVFRRVGRWDCLVVDEGQRLKSGKDSQLYNAISTLRIAHRVILSGTPLNNNLRELFNLLAFINPGDYEDIDALTERFAELTPDLVEEVREMLKPYFLRRTKDLVLNLSPLLELVVPVSMTVLQRQIYRGVLERNASAIQSIVQTSGSKKRGAKPKKGGFVNILMELRKSLCHPYLTDRDIEPQNVSPQEAHRNLTNASAKFVLLATMLPKLKAAGHRVLIFSQFKITLNIIERFLAGLELKYLRLDGDTPQLERQRDVDKFNAPGSEYFAYILSTRAGGVGLNITSADVVIIYDQDFNPQMDLQAISRAHRIGQTKPVRVFKLLVKGTCEEKIHSAGNKKRGLEHLIIQRIDAKDESEDVEGMLQFGAKQVFDDEAAAAAAIRYTDADIDNMLAKTAEPLAKESESAQTFSHAQVWSNDAGDMQAIAAAEDAPPDDLHDFWSNVVEQQEKEREKEQATKAAQAQSAGRSKRKRAQVNYRLEAPISPDKKGKGKQLTSPSSSVTGDLSSGDEYRQRDGLETDDEQHEPMEIDKSLAETQAVSKPPPLARLDQRNAQDGRTKQSKKSKTALDSAEEVARAAERKQKAEQRLDKIRLQLAAAERAGVPEARDLLQQALVSTSRTTQTSLLRQATILLDARAKSLRHEALVANPAILNRSATMPPPPRFPTATKPSSVPQLAAAPKESSARPFPSVLTVPPSSLGQFAPRDIGSDSTGVVSKPSSSVQAGLPQPPSSVPGASDRSAGHVGSDRASSAAPPIGKGKTSKSPPSTSTSDKPVLARRDSGAASDSSSASSSSRTPKLKQTQLSFGKATASIAPATTAASTSSTAASNDAPPPTSDAKQTKSPTVHPAASSATIPQKRPSPPSDEPAKKSKSNSIIYISDSE
ncbi:uncharacterized protein JCM10292_002374 [Rhodotorula paludigena]|uniref:uncharacterized protein n=1 Tax=Rhodotorula paludigena TaxID=86838 RepID=UPI00316DC3B1